MFDIGYLYGLGEDEEESKDMSTVFKCPHDDIFLEVIIQDYKYKCYKCGYEYIRIANAPEA